MKKDELTCPSCILLATEVEKLANVTNALIDKVIDLTKYVKSQDEKIENLAEDIAIMETHNPIRAIDELKDAVAKHTDIPRWQLD